MNKDELKAMKENETKEAEALKEEGNKLFKEKKFKEAIECFTKAINSISKKYRENVAVYYGNRSNCYFQLGELTKALEDADQAISHNCLWWRAYYRKAKVLQKQGDLPKALEEIERAVKCDPDIKELNDFHTELLTESGKIERKKKEEEEEKQKGFNPNKLMDVKNFKEIPMDPFHEEYQAAYPDEKDHFNILKEMHHIVTETYISDFCVLNTDSDTHLSKEYLLMRFGVLGVNLDKFVVGRDVGDIMTKKNEFKQKYLEKDKTELIYNSFSIAPQFMEYLLTYGKTYATISPMDLNILLNYTCKGDKSKDGPINIHVYEGCPFAYSKSMIILDLLRRKVNPHFLIQIWYSSAWSRVTEKEFLISCGNVLNSLDQSESEARTVLEKWLSSDPVPLQEARDSWLKATTVKRHLFYNIKNKKDRLEVMRYVMTGEFLVCHVGSRTMFINPFSNYKKAADESFIHSINLMNVDFAENSTFLSSIINHVIKKVKIIQEELEKETFKVTIFYKDICPKEVDYISTLKSNNYWTVFWSNIVDYYSRENFHLMAKAISSENTIHCLYSVYWYQEVFGTDIYDYHSTSRRSMMEKVSYAFTKGYAAISYSSLSKRIREIPISGVQHRFQFTSKIMFKEKWSAYYLECLNRTKQMPYVPYFGLTAFDTIVYTAFTYNNKIKLRDGADYLERKDNQ